MGAICAIQKVKSSPDRDRRSQSSEQQKQRINPRITNLDITESFQDEQLEKVEQMVPIVKNKIPKRKKSQNQSVQNRREEDSSQQDENENQQSRIKEQKRVTLKKNTSAQLQKVQTSTKDYSQSSEQNSSPHINQQKQFQSRQTINGGDEALMFKAEKVTVKSNQAKDLLALQRDFYWDQFQTELDQGISEKSLVNDIFQMMKMFFSHIETSLVYWTKFWLVSSSANKDVVIAYQSNLGEIRKIRILYTKNIEIVSLIIDNYYYFSELGYKTKDLIKIHEYNFRINKKWLNFYVFSEQEYQEYSLEQVMKSQGQLITFDTELLKDLILFLMRTLNMMHSNGYIHGGIKQSNVYLYFNQDGKIQFKLDISFDTVNYSRRNQKNKELRLSEIYDLEDVAFLVFSLQLKENARAHLKNKLMEFSSAMSKESEYVSFALKYFLLLLSRDSQIQYDLRTADLYKLFQSLTMKNYQQSGNFQVKKKGRKKAKLLWRVIPKHSLLIFYPVTISRTSKSILKIRLQSHQNKNIRIISVSDNGEGIMFILYEESKQLHIGSIDMKKKQLNDGIEDTTEIFILVMRQIMDQLEDGTKKKDKMDSSGTAYSLQLNTQSPNSNIDGPDMFKFTHKEKDNLTKKNVNGAFYDRIYFTPQSIQKLFARIDADYKGYITRENIIQFINQMGENMDDSLIKQLLSYQGNQANTSGLSDMLDFFFTSKQLSLMEFQQIFNFFSKKFKPIYKLSLTLVESNTSPCQSIISYDRLIFLVNQSQVKVIQLPTLEVKKTFEISQVLFEPKMQFNDEQFVLYGLNDQNILNFYVFNYNFELIRVIDSQLTVSSNYLLSYSKLNSHYFVFSTPTNQGQCQCTAFLLKEKHVQVIYETKIQETLVFSSFMNIFIEDQTILFIDEQLILNRIWILIDIQLFVVTQTSIMKILNDFGRCDTKIRLRTSQRNQQQFHLTTSHDPIGKYLVQSLIYPQSGTNIATIAQFRLLTVQNPQLGSKNLMLLQRSVHGEFESFDDCYSVCRYLDSQHLLRDFFLTYEFDSRVRLNYVFDEGDQFPTTKCNDWLIWSYMRRSLKSLLRLKLNGIVIQEMHPDNITINDTEVSFMTQMYKLNIPSVFTDKFVPIQGCLEFMEPKLLQGSLQQQFQNQLLLNPSKSNVYSLGLIFLRTLSQQNRKGTNDLSVYTMELHQILSTLSTTPYVKSIIEEMLKDNEEQRMDYQQILIKMKRIEQTSYHEIYFDGPQKQISNQPMKFGRMSSEIITNGFHFVFMVTLNSQRIDLTIINGNQFTIQKTIQGVVSVSEQQVIDLVGVYKDTKIYAEGNYRNISILVKMKDLNDLSVEYKLLFFRISILTDDISLVNLQSGSRDEHQIQSVKAKKSLEKTTEAPTSKDAPETIEDHTILLPFLMNDNILNFNDFSEDQIISHSEALPCPNNESDLISFTRLKLQIDNKDNLQCVRSREVKIDVYEFQDCESMQTIMVDDCLYLLGGRFNLLNSYHNNLECYQYNLKKQISKRIGQLESPMGDSSVIEVKESIYIFDCYGVGACYSVKVLSRAPYSVRNRSIKLKNSLKRDPQSIQVFKLNNMLACAYSHEEEDAWLINLETFNTIHLDVMKVVDKITLTHKKCLWVSDVTDPITIIYQSEQGFLLISLTIDIQKCSIKIQKKLI